jgi:hypothetical protein
MKLSAQFSTTSQEAESSTNNQNNPRKAGTE